MLQWSPGAVKATVGVGGLGLMVLLLDLSAGFGVKLSFPVVFVLAFAPMVVFMMTGDVEGKPWARHAQRLADDRGRTVVVIGQRQAHARRFAHAQPIAIAAAHCLTQGTDFGEVGKQTARQRLGKLDRSAAEPQDEAHHRILTPAMPTIGR